MRGATAAKGKKTVAAVFQSTRPMRGATAIFEPVYVNEQISIHAPHAGRDHFQPEAESGKLEFQSTRPMRGATRMASFVVGIFVIFQSTRPMRGATRRRGGNRRKQKHFNPRAPCGARPALE